MHSITTFVSALCLATSVLAQSGNYGSDYGSSSSGSSGSSEASSTENGYGSSGAEPKAALASSSPSTESATPSTESATPSDSTKVHVVKVSNKNGELKFEPNNFHAEAGHLVQFQFWPKVDLCSTPSKPCKA
jgi:hypothetical protein